MDKQVIYAAFATLGFALVYNLKGKNLIFATIGGGLGWMAYLMVLNNTSKSIALASLAGSIAITFYSELISRFIKVPTIALLIPALIPLVPGGGVYFTILSLVHNDFPDALKYGMETLTTSLCLTIGILTVSTFDQIITQIKIMIRKYHKHKLNK